MNSISPSAIVVGAGASGLSAASHLVDAGWSVVILEAASRMGGRIRHLEGFADFHVELGAEEIHGKDNCLPILARKAGARMIRHRTSNDYMRIAGRVVPLSHASRLKGMREILDFVANVSEYTGPAWSVEQAANARHFSRDFWHYLESRMGVEHGTTLDRLGMRGFRGYERSWQLREENYTVDIPYVELLRPFVEKVGSRVFLDSPVVAVEWNTRRPVVRVSGGTKMRCDAVVFTGSLAVLRDSPPAFTPQLPPKKSKALANIGMDGGMKVVMRFSRRFWPKDMYFLHSDTYWPQFWTPGRLRGGKSNVLTAFVGARRASLLAEMGVGVAEFGVGELARIFGKVASESFEEAHVADWSSEPFVRGLYSFPLPATTPADRKALASQLGGKLFFAGEATDLEGHAGTVHGAIASGRRVASEVLACRKPAA